MSSLVAQTVKRLPTMQETWVQSQGRDDLLEKEMATHASILAWNILKIPWTEEPDRLQSMRLQRVGHNWATSLSFSLYKSMSENGIAGSRDRCIFILNRRCAITLSKNYCYSHPPAMTESICFPPIFSGYYWFLILPGGGCSRRLNCVWIGISM